MNRFWHSLERVSGLQAIPAFWAEYAGPHFELLRPHLCATDIVGGLYPCPHPSPGHCPRRIVDYGDGNYAALCRDPYKVCPDVPLQARDVVVQELNIGGITRTFAAALGLRWQPPVPRGDCTWAIGISLRQETRGLPVFLLVLPATPRFRAAMERLLLDVSGPFVIVAPTNSHRSVEVQEHVQRRGLAFLAIEDHVGLADDGQFAALNSPADPDRPMPTPVADRPRAVKEFTVRHKCKVKDIQVAAGEDEADYYKWLHGKLPDHYSTCIAIERVLRDGLGNGKPQRSAS
ncbi:MAG: hypothetical protein NTW28_25195 [Candidatus Solibacter sp.]|nr:hypothetical protein [Candidatus Solibacter sp.]